MLWGEKPGELPKTGILSKKDTVKGQHLPTRHKIEERDILVNRAETQIGNGQGGGTSKRIGHGSSLPAEGFPGNKTQKNGICLPGIWREKRRPQGGVW